MRGANLGELMAIAGHLDLSPRALSVDLQSVAKLSLPAILHWELNHFVVLASVNGDRFLVHDPARGKRSCSVQEVSSRFTGVALELRPAMGFRAQDERRRMRLRDFWGRVAGLKTALLQTLLLSALIQLFVLAAPFYMQLVVDEVLTRFDIDLLLVLALGFGLLLFMRELAIALRAWQIIYLSSSLDFAMGSNLARRLFELPLAWFEKRHTGDVISRFSSTHAIRRLFAEGLVAAVIDGIMALSTLLIMCLYSPLLACVVLLAVSVYLAARMAFYRSLRDRTEDEILARATEQSALIESIRAIQSIKIFGKEAQRHSLWQNRFADSVNCSVRLGRLQAGFSIVSGVVFGIENIVVVYLGAIAAINGSLTIGMLFAFVAYKQHLVKSAVALIERLIEFRVLELHLDRIADIALSDPEPGSPGGCLPLARPGMQAGQETLITLSGITYAYGKSDTPLIRNASLDIRRGDWLTVIGPSGVGKSTFLKVLLGLLEPNEGAIAYRGRPLATLSRSAYRRQFGTVMQDDALLSGSLAENIAFFDPSPDLGRIEHCASLACVHDEIVMMPMGYNSLVGDMGSVLSAGQRQRVLLARALYAEPEILVLDEGTANLDTASEQGVVRALAGLGLTIVCVTHGDTAARCAGRVVLMRDGKLHELPADFADATGRPVYDRAGS